LIKGNIDSEKEAEEKMEEIIKSESPESRHMYEVRPYYKAVG
jgi:hypothetical protein